MGVPAECTCSGRPHAPEQARGGSVVTLAIGPVFLSTSTLRRSGPAGTDASRPNAYRRVK